MTNAKCEFAQITNMIGMDIPYIYIIMFMFMFVNVYHIRYTIYGSDRFTCLTYVHAYIRGNETPRFFVNP